MAPGTIYDSDEKLNEQEQNAHLKGSAQVGVNPGAAAELNRINKPSKPPGQATSTGSSASNSPKKDEDKGTGNFSFKPGEGADKDAASKGKSKGKSSRRKKGIAALVISLVLSVGGFDLVSTGVGPFQLIDVAQNMLHPNKSNENAGDSSVGQLMRYAKAGGDVGETRLGYLGSKLTANTIKKLNGIGLQPDYGKLTTYEGFTIDTKNKSSPYYKMNEDQVKAALAKQKITTGITAKDGKISVSTEGYFANKGSERALVSNLGVSKLATAARVRYLSKYGLVTWHPLKVIDAKIAKTGLALWEKAREKFMKTGQGGSTIDATGAQEKDANGKVTDIAGGETTPTTAEAGSTLKSIAGSTSFKVAGGVAAAVGLVCVLHAVGEHIHVIVYAQAIVPAERMAWDGVTVGQQLMFGKDVDLSEAGAVAEQLYDIKTKTSWNSGKTYDPSGNGVDMDSGTKSLMAGQLPSWLQWTQSSTVNDLCGTVGTAVTTTVSVVVGVLSGGIVSTAVGFVASALAAPLVIDHVAKLATGGLVDPDSAGGERGVDMNYGAVLNANTVAVQNGGSIASSTTTSRITNEQEQESKKQFQSKNLAYRLFNPTDSRTLISHIIENSSTSGTQNMAILANGFMHMGSTLLRMPATLFTSVAHAAAPAVYTYPFPMYLAPDPTSAIGTAVYENPDSAAKILDSNNSNGEPDYIAKAAKCNNVTIAKDSQGLWDVVPGAGSNVDAFDVYDPATYNPNDCADNGDANWKTIQQFILATNSAEGYACVATGDDQSCQNDGFTNVDAQGNPAAAASAYNTQGVQQQAAMAGLAYQETANNQAPLQPLLAAGANQNLAKIGRLLGAIF